MTYELMSENSAVYKNSKVVFCRKYRKLRKDGKRGVDNVLNDCF
jgi:hypothetical protein